MKKIIIASDSFKGSVSSEEVAQNIRVAVHNIFPDCEVIEISLADGGEGTMHTLVSLMQGEIITCRVHDPLMKLIEAEYGILGDGKTAIIEMATASGLPLVPKSKRNPLIATTFGVGELIRDALKRGCTKFLVGIGGSATNDAGTGMLQALGFRFLNKEGKELEKGGRILEQIYDIDEARVLSKALAAHFIVACDVNNPFFGSEGAALVFAPQKGATDEMVNTLDKGMKHFAEVIKKKKKKDISYIPGSGAAGGVGGGFVAFLNAELKPGIEIVLETLDFEARLKGADLVITGEGKLDRQTTMGKAPAGVLKIAQRMSVPVIAIGGTIEDSEVLNEFGFLAVNSIVPGPVNLESAMEKEFTCLNIRRSIEQQLRLIRFFNHKQK